MIARVIAVVLAVLLTSCTRAPREVTFHASGYPETLAEWGLFTVAGGRIVPHRGMVTYELATPLFSDYAQKWRTVYVPKGAHAVYDPLKAFDFPVGTIVTKTFYYSVPASAAVPQQSDTVLKVTPATYQRGVSGLDLKRVRLIETRLLVRRAAGWVALPYVWNAAGTDATLERTGADVPLSFDDGGKTTRFVYAVPNQNQCAGCHVADFRDRKLEPIGLKARHLNRVFDGGDQLQRFVALGYLTGVPVQGVPRNADWLDPRATVEAAAHAYLDINCSHCHSAAGPARTSGLWLDFGTTDQRLRGLCKPPVAAGRGTGDRPFDMVPGHADRSILAYRLESDDPGAMMPELGRSLTHREGVALIERYINGLTGNCDEVDGRPRLAAG